MKEISWASATAGILAVGKGIEETDKGDAVPAGRRGFRTDQPLLWRRSIREEDAAEIYRRSRGELYPDVDVDAHFGGQPIYYYVLAVDILLWGRSGSNRMSGDV